MNLFELFVKIDADTSQAEKGMKSTQGVSETLTNKIKVMSAQFEAAQKNVDKLTQEFNESVNKAGATDKATQELAKKLAEAEKEAGNFAKELNEAQKEAEEAKKSLDACNEEIEDTGEKAEKSVKGLSNFASKLGNGLATAAKIGAAAVGAAAAGITALTTAAVNNYAEYEQLVGGVETLFKTSSDAVMKYAENAYKTAGLSANEYMETVTSFSASLLQSLGGDTVEAAEYADLAITDMADNANKMGSSIDTIQTAYAGFAKQNYTLLDNLKLGYGGTKEEMQRLIADAAELSDTVDAQSLSFENIVEAIHVVQTEMGITGTTAKEAGTTIQGSVASMKSAWQNLLTGLADGNANIEDLVNDLVETVVGDGTESNLGVIGNILPAVETALTGASTLVSELIPQIVQIIPSVITKNLPILAEAAISIVQSLVDGISNNQEMLMTTAFETITYLATSLISMLPQIVELGLGLMVSLANGIAENVDELLPAVLEAVTSIGNALIENAPELINAGIELASAIMNGILEQFEGLEPIIMAVVAAFGAYKAITLASEIASKAMAAGQLLVNAAMNANPITLVVTLIAGLVAAVITLWNTNEGFRTAVITAWEAIKSAASTIFTAIAEFFTVTIPEAFNSFVTFISTGVSNFLSIGSEIVANIKQGITDAWNGLVEWFNGIWDSLFGGRSVDVSVSGSGTATVDGSHAGGLSYVPYDGYIAELHQGERVLTAAEAANYNNPRPSVNVVQNIYSEARTAADLMQEALYHQERAVLLGV